ncbi:MAG: RdgB/HAM1 family non-canonical purine NTP pyrophosphatase [Bacilli bacterium]|nr:RdgB/HAM1 family non-canonical purine NTP pyrophosphatase [Bacilli bacterium]MDY6430849.1 RdgB/HAM1 family non-canonical purine NTP pyrophosphatase [Bacilli bacterium]
MNKEIVLATNNAHKLEEYRQILAPLGYVIYSISDLNLNVEVDETGANYEENSYLKAKALAELVPFPVISDDSGIEIEALGNKPGLNTARFLSSFPSREECFSYIIKETKKKNNNRAKFVCTICLLQNSIAKPLYFKGICPGTILEEPHGSNGFGYDPIFKSDEGNFYFGTCSPQEKNSVSHRAKAITKLKLFLIL